MVFPAHAGVILKERPPTLDIKCLSRTCGGDPAAESTVEIIERSFPHMRG